MASQQFDRFKSTLNELFMLNQADLDFGIYRIMNQKRRDIEAYLNTRLPNQVKTLLEQNASNRSADLQRQLDDAIAQTRSLGVDPEKSPKVQELRKAIEQQGSPVELENSVYSHLATFFSRYYDGGDFISLRRYKKDVYAIPYEGEEVKLHWANADQYYIKTGEYFRAYSFKLDDDKKVEFTLKEVTTEQNNNLPQNNMERRFALYEECPIEVNGDTLQINFTYELYPKDNKATKQNKLIEDAYNKVKDLIPSEFMSVLALRSSDKDRNRTLLQKHLNDYVAKNTFDYFIHKDLRGFLSRELDFYIKNEILFIDDINARSTEEFLQHLTVIKAIKAVGQSLIDFLAQLEEFQKRLWLKKKFVVETNWCITLDNIDESFYAEIAANEAQTEDWINLFAIDKIEGDLETPAFSRPLTIDFLRANKNLVLDTRHFSRTFRNRLIASIDNLDEKTDGVLINSDNFHALNLMGDKYQNRISCIYGDPPYNAKSSEILYKNSFKHSSWISMMDGRLKLAARLKTEKGAIITAIDENEGFNLMKLMDVLFPEWNKTAVTVLHNPAGVQGDNFSYSHEYAIFTFENYKHVIGKKEKEEVSTEPFRDWGPTGLRNPEGETFYPIYVSKDGTKIVGFGAACESNFHPGYQNVPKDSYIEVYPIGDDGVEKKWVFARNTVEDIADELFTTCSNGVIQIYRNKSKGSFKTVWDDKKYYANIYGSKLLNEIMGGKFFDFPKSVFTIADCIHAVNEVQKTDAIILDYFAGSGTTGHAVVNLNRIDGKNRKYILCEMGSYFNKVTLPRVKKIIYSPEWKKGKPQRRDAGISQIVKYMRLEQYEDTLNNLTIQPCQTASEGQFADGFLLGYMLDVETRDSLLNLKWFVNPFDVKLNITRQNETVEENIDLPETFNYLIGLNVAQMSWPKAGIMVVEGTTRAGKKALVIWRDCNKIDNATLNEFFTRSAYSVRDNEFDVIYVNGDNNLENVRTEEDTWKVTLIEQEFNRKMFE